MMNILQRSLWRHNLGMAVLMVLAVSLLSVLPKTTWAAPLAGTVIGNQASATYTDASNAPRTATSNTVNTIIQPVAGFTLTASQDKYSTPGGTVYFGHTLTNTGNSVDTFGLTKVNVTGGGFTFSSVTIYPDNNGDGLPDDFNAITTTTAVPAGGVFQFVIAAVVPSTATANQKDSLTVTGVSTVNTTVTVVNTDTVTVVNTAVMSLTKSESVASGGLGATNGIIRYTFTYTNTGNAIAKNVTIKDTLDGNLAYVTANKARWSVTGVTALTDANNGVQGTGTTIDYYTYTAGSTTNIWAQINQVPAGTSGTLSFDVYAATDPSNHIIPNVGQVTYLDTLTATTPTTVGSNHVFYTVVPTAGTVAVVLYDTYSTTDLYAFKATTGTQALDDIIDVYSAFQGATVLFDNVVKNKGGAIDTFNIEPYANTTYVNTFPVGTSFLFLKDDGATPLMDTNGDGVPDTGPIAKNGVYHVFVKAILPTSASGTGTTPGSGYKFPLVAISTTLNTVSDPTTDRLYKIVASGVDLTNNSAGATAPGNGVKGTKIVANTAGAITTGVINPGDSYSFALYVSNNSSVPDSFDLLGSMSGKNTGFGTVSDVYSGWTLDFRNDGGVGNCSTTGQSISNTGVINAGANKLVCAVVTTPSTQAAGTTNIYFRVKSPTSLVLDIKMDAITVNTLRIININTNNAGQIFPGGSIVYTHIITNAGNVTEGADPYATVTAGKSGVGLALSQTLTAQGWTSVIYWDKNNDGILDQLDPVVNDLSVVTVGTGLGLDAGESTTLFVKVFAPLGAAINTIDTATIKATTKGVINTIVAPTPIFNTDNTTVIAGQVRLVKTQAPDVDCNGVVDTTYTFVTTDLNEKPGQCIMYKITATNAGSADVTGLKVSDATPAFTTYYDTGSAGCTGTVGLNPAAATNGGGTSVAVTILPAPVASVCGKAATFSAVIGTLTPQQSGTLTFNVRINP